MLADLTDMHGSSNAMMMALSYRELLLDGAAVTAAVRPSSVSKANSIFADKSFMPEGAT